MKWLTIIIMILVLPMVMADMGTIETYKPNEVVDLSIHLINSTGEMDNANCTYRVMNSSFGIIEEKVMMNTGKGWYNATYNTSNVGKYYCRQNCTADVRYIANVCDFVIEGDETVAIAIMIGMAIVIVALFVLSRFIRIEVLKYLLISIAMIMVISTLAISLFLSEETLPTSVQEVMKNNYVVVLYTLDFIIAISFFFVLFYYVTKWLPSVFRGKKK